MEYWYIFMSDTMRSPTTLMPRLPYLEFFDNLEQITINQVLQRKANILLVISFLLLLLLLLYKLML
jgi:hypothetical protein